MSDGRSGSKAARVQFDLQAPSMHGGTEPMTNQPQRKVRALRSSPAPSAARRFQR